MGLFQGSINAHLLNHYYYYHIVIIYDFVNEGFDGLKRLETPGLRRHSEIHSVTALISPSA